MREDALVEGVRNLEEDPGAVARARIGPGGAAVAEATEDLEPLADDVVAGGGAPRPTKLGDEAEAAGVVLEGRVVESACSRQSHERRLGLHRGDAAR